MPALLRFGVGAVAAAALAAGAAAVQPRAPVTFGPSRHRGLNALRHDLGVSTKLIFESMTPGSRTIRA